MWELIQFRYYWPLITSHILLLWAGDCWNEELSDVFSWQDDWIIKCMPWEQLIASPGPGSRWLVVGVSQSTNLTESRAENREFHFPVIRQNKPRVLPRPRKSFSSSSSRRWWKLSNLNQKIFETQSWELRGAEWCQNVSSEPVSGLRNWEYSPQFVLTWTPVNARLSWLRTDRFLGSLLTSVSQFSLALVKTTPSHQHINVA